MNLKLNGKVKGNWTKVLTVRSGHRNREISGVWRDFSMKSFRFKIEKLWNELKFYRSTDGASSFDFPLRFSFVGGKRWPDDRVRRVILDSNPKIISDHKQAQQSRKLTLIHSNGFQWLEGVFPFSQTDFGSPLWFIFLVEPLGSPSEYLHSFQ